MRAVVKMAWAALMIGVLSAGAAAQQAVLHEPPTAPLRLKQVKWEQMPRADRALLGQARGRLARAARVFAYRMQEPGWSCDEVMTPDTPDYLMVVCRRPRASEGGESAFSALIARGSDAVYVVPVLYGGAAPWKTAANLKTSREIFNHVVPAKVAAGSIAPRGKWMKLALTYTALAGDDAVVLAAPSSKLKWARAPEPTMMLRNGARTRTVLFSDVSPKGGIRRWTLKFNEQGRLTGADVRVTPYAAVQAVSTKTPKWRKLNHLPSPMGNAKPAPPTRH